MAISFTSREFREQQAHVFDLADQGEQVIIRRRRKQAYILVPITESNESITPELQTKIDKAREEYKKGETLGFASSEALNAWLDSL